MSLIDEATKLCFILNQDDFTAQVSRSPETSLNIFIPRSIKQGLHEYKVTGISKCAFKNCNQLYSVNFPEDSELEIIDDEAFSNAYSLRFIVIPDKVKKIGDNAFYCCSELSKLIISNNSELVSIGKFAFTHCRYLKINFIPSHVKFIGESAFIGCNISESIISENSELVSYENDVFNKTNIDYIYIPEKMSHLKDNWCNFSECFKDIKVSPKNKFFKYIDGVLLVGKTDEKSDNYDILYFVNPQVKQIKIPSNIKYIKPNAFQYCAELQTIEIPPDSQIKTFYKKFAECTSNSNIFIPSQVSEFEEGWCSTTKYTGINITISPENKFFKCINDILIVGKSNKDSDKYNSLYFVNSNESSVVIIPSFIKYIKPYAFSHCNSLDTVEFQSISQLQTIESYGFARLNANYIVIPKSVKNICEFAFCESEIHSLKFQEGSEIVSIGKSVFESSCITTIDIPSSVKEIKEKAFYKCKRLKNINFSEDSELVFIDISDILNSNIENFYIPPKLENLIYNDYSFSDELPKIIVSPNNKNFKFLNNEMLVGKSDKEIDQYDILYLLLCNSKNIKIPAEIKIINPYAIKNSKFVETIEFESGSQLTEFVRCFGFEANIEHILIPKHVKSIYSCAFQRTKLKTIEFEKDSELVLIDKYSFDDIRNLTSITIPSSVQYINYRAFCFCEKLENVKFPEDSQLISIGEEAFSKTLIKEIVLPRHLQVIERGAFQGCYRLKSVTFSDNSELITIKSSAFMHTAIESLTIPDSVKNIENGLFDQPYKLSEFNISENSELVSIRSIFSGSNIENLFIPPKVSYISTYMISANKKMNIKLSPKNPYFKFIDNKILVGKSNKESDDFDVLYLVIQDEEQIKIPSSIKRIVSYAFCRSPNIKSIEFPLDSKLNYIEKSAFDFLLIEHIVIPKNVKYIVNRIFGYRSNIQTIEFADGSELEWVFDNVFGSLQIESINIPPHLKNISKELFKNCQMLKHVNIPENSELVSIESEAFSNTLIESLFIPEKVEHLEDGWCDGAYSLFNITVSPKNKNYKIIDDILLVGKSEKESNDFDSLILVLNDINNIEVPFYIKYIKNNAFTNCINPPTVVFHPNCQIISFNEAAFANSLIEEITIPKSVKIIGKKAFYRCQNLQIVEFQSGSQLYLIESEAFQSTEITKISFPKSLKQIKSDAFTDCNFLCEVIFPPDSELEIIGQGAFSHLPSLKKVCFPKSLKEIQNYAFFECIGIQKVSFPKNSEVEYFGFGSFAKSGLEKFIVPSSVKSIHQAAFAECNKLKKFYFEENSKLAQIDYAAFNNTGITTFIIPASVKLGSDVFKETYAFIEFLGDDIDLNNQYFQFEDNSVVLAFPDAKNISFGHIYGDATVLVVPGASIQ